MLTVIEANYRCSRLNTKGQGYSLENVFNVGVLNIKELTVAIIS
jgi:hypothetical protein